MARHRGGHRRRRGAQQRLGSRGDRRAGGAADALPDGPASYALETGSAIRRAADDDDGASVINLSAGYPCQVLTVLGNDNLCSTGGRAGFCLKVTAAVTTAAAVVCATVGWIPIAGQVACATAISAASLTITACWSFVLAGDILRGPMEEGVAYALGRGVPVVSISGNKQSGGLLCDLVSCDNHSVDDWQIIPGVIDGVICVAAAEEYAPFANAHFYGRRVDVWATKHHTFFHPPTLDAVTGPDAQILSPDPIGGTSAAAPFVTGIIAMMQAANPGLNPNTPGLTDDERRTIPSRIRDILRTTATPAASLPPPTGPADATEVGRRRNLVHAYGLLRAAVAIARPADRIPDASALGFDVGAAAGDEHLGFDEGATEPPARRSSARRPA